MVRALPVVSTSPPIPVAVMGSERTGCAVVVPVVPFAAWFRPPRVPASTAAVRLVVNVVAFCPAGPPWPPPGPAWVPAAVRTAASVAFRSRSELVPTTELTLGTAAAVTACSAVSGSPPPSKPWPPAGLTVRTVPTDAFSSWTLAPTAWLATSMDSASPIATARTATTAAVRTLFLKALPTLRERTLTVLLGSGARGRPASAPTLAAGPVQEDVRSCVWAVKGGGQ
ncbi:hypothetical protein AHiyo4_12780 [Arthrobacter sp. Hiyo4]|nr:hypothetical protein AHiyo4_12780 [Arthrobacter sp. Hiyo4]